MVPENISISVLYISTNETNTVVLEKKLTTHSSIADFSRAHSGNAVDPEKMGSRVVFVVVACVQVRTFLIHLHAYTDPSLDIIRGPWHR